MLEIIPIYFIGRYYYNLAGEYKKKQWPFAVLGVVIYYAGMLLGGFLLGMVLGVLYPSFIDETPSIVLGLMAIPLGVLTTWGLYAFLKKKWSDESRGTFAEDIVDQEF